MPYCLLSDHTLPVTDILCGVGLFPECRILTSSLDHSVKVNISPILSSQCHVLNVFEQLWDLSSRSLLTTFHFPLPISCLAWDVMERLFFAASSQGSIYQMNLFREYESKFGLGVEAIGGAGPTDVIRFENHETRKERRKRMISVEFVLCFRSLGMTLF